AAEPRVGEELEITDPLICALSQCPMNLFQPCSSRARIASHDRERHPPRNVRQDGQTVEIIRRHEHCPQGEGGRCDWLRPGRSNVLGVLYSIMYYNDLLLKPGRVLCLQKIGDGDRQVSGSSQLRLDHVAHSENSLHARS